MFMVYFSRNSVLQVPLNQDLNELHLRKSCHYKTTFSFDYLWFGKEGLIQMLKTYF